MEWDEYKPRCAAPGAFSRWMLEQSLELVATDVAAASQLRAVLAGRTLDKPADHRGGADTDIFELGFDLAIVERIVARVAAAATQGASTSGTVQRGLGGFDAAWREYARFLSQMSERR